jgi:hypothetical protein
MGNDSWAALPHVWMSIGLPGFKANSTYQGYALEKMPRIPIELDDNLVWLGTHGTPRPGQGLDRLESHPLPPTAALDLAALAGLTLPTAFSRFMASADLQSRVQSCTDCYLDPGQRVVETIGSVPGSLLHFLSDSQCCSHWYLHVLPNGHSAILESVDLYGYSVENSDWMENPACRLEQIDLAEVDIHFCAPSFSDFLFRFWIENEIWYALHVDERQRPLNALEIAYLANTGIEI